MPLGKEGVVFASTRNVTKGDGSNVFASSHQNPKYDFVTKCLTCTSYICINKISPKKKQKSLVWYSVPSEGTYYLLLYFMHTYFAFRYVPESISLHSSFLFFLRLLRKVDRLWLKRTNLNDDHLNLIILRSLNH